MQEHKHVRFAVQRPVSFRGDLVASTGTILNISRQGCAIVSDTIAEAQAYLQLQVPLLEEEELVQVDLAAVEPRPPKTALQDVPNAIPSRHLC